MRSKGKGGKPLAKASSPLLQQLASRPDKLFANAFLQQYGALCFRRVDGSAAIEILVITSRDSGRWIIPKGWPMKKKKPYEAAAIEAWEEAGVRGTVSKRPVGHYTYLKELGNGDIAPCIVDVFQVETEESRGEFKELGQRTLDWVTPDEAARRVREVELKSLLVRFRPRSRKGSP
ncbi:MULTISPECIES: NUDIX hydrolase [Rhizobium]|uniref:NUDIX hydrolase n=1 Tax=Rhizobium TaxID=379 RepID=UPI001039C46A|nr:MULTISPECIES: NUDIX hydrolase [Rhizobium]MBY3053893.1 NUDIX hydrolase [Rhizobium laguerreae]MBY5385295.1 NUDIX hydrolase [Rhizobium leguminosarum]MBY5788140.1 NUDIX hydrolase [Rhizobium leguminosarum]MCA2435553.1 NUDIX hydrolase [Rhizobium leguminosarum]NEH73669.1 NUDIX domain-containing protein [Rhizobium leguminosarum]